MAQDALGNEVTTTDPATLAGIDDFVTGFLGYETKATNVLAAADADPDSVLANIYAGFTWMFLEAAGAEEQRAALSRSRTALRRPAPTRASCVLLGQLERWIAGDIAAVQRIGDAIVEQHPTDLASVKLHQYFSFNRGDAAAMLRIAEAALPANADNPHIHGMLAFGLEQMHRIPEAEARRAPRPRAQGEGAVGAACAGPRDALDRPRARGDRLPRRGARKTWVDLNCFMYTHNWWHKALFHISLGDTRRGARCLRQPRLGHRAGLLAGPGRRGVAAGAHGGRRHRRRQPLGGRWPSTSRPAPPTPSSPSSRSSISTASPAPSAPKPIT